MTQLKPSMPTAEEAVVTEEVATQTTGLAVAEQETKKVATQTATLRVVEHVAEQVVEEVATQITTLAVANEVAAPCSNSSRKFSASL